MAPPRLDGRIVIVTGAARGQGAAEARRFVAEGARVVLGDVLEEEGRALADELGDAAVFAPLDVTDEERWHAVVGDTTDRWGGLDVLVNNAGVLSFHRTADTPTDEFRRIVDVNLLGPFLGIKAVVPAMRVAGGGSIVNVSSTAGLVGMPAVGAYVASKHGLTGLTRAAAMDHGRDGIRVNSVHPGSIDTPMVMVGDLGPDDFAPFTERLPIPRMGTPEDVANLVLFLASDESAYCTGAAFVVDGGQTVGDLGALG